MIFQDLQRKKIIIFKKFVGNDNPQSMGKSEMSETNPETIKSRFVITKNAEYCKIRWNTIGLSHQNMK